MPRGVTRASLRLRVARHCPRHEPGDPGGTGGEAQGGAVAPRDQCRVRGKRIAWMDRHRWRVIPTSDCEQLPFVGDALEAMEAAIIKAQTRPGDEVPHRARHEHLAGVRHRGDPCPDVHGDAANVIAGKHDLAGVNSGADLETDSAHGRRDLLGTPDGPCRSVERGQKAVAGRVHLATAVAGDEPRDSTVVRLEELDQRRSPSSAARTVEPAMSVNSTVASTRSGSAPLRPPVRNCSTSSRTASLSPTHGMWSFPASSTNLAPARARRYSARTRLGPRRHCGAAQASARPSPVGSV